MTRAAAVCAVLALVTATGACQSAPAAGGASARGEQRRKAARPEARKAPAGCPLARISAGMKRAEVYEILGQPTSTRRFPSGKAFNPFYFGPDNIRTGASFKGLGRVVFSGADIVVEVEYDPTEDGR